MAQENPVVVDYVLPDRKSPELRARAPLPSYTLALLLGQTPERLHGRPVVARVHDERARGPYDPVRAAPDILCLTYLTTGAPRAFQIGDAAMAARSHAGVPIRVVHGGVHATCLPREALAHGNLVVRGEADPAFQERVLARALEMDPWDREVARIPVIPAVLRRPPADWSWMRRRDYFVAPSVQTSVGCPFHCDFCSVTQVFGAAMRAVDRDCLRQELSRIRRGTLVAVIDDNFLQGIQPRHVEHCMDVARLMREMGLRWVTEVTVRTLIDARRRLAREHPGFDLVRFFAQHGCRGLFLGIETVGDDGAGLPKARPCAEVLDIVRRCQDEGIGILGAFVLGLGPDETPDYAKRVLDFAIEKARLDFAQFSINTPMPGSRSFLCGIRDGTILNFDWELYDAEHCVIRHPRMSPRQLEACHQWLYKEFYAHRSLRTRYPAAALLSLRPSVWRRAAVGIPVNLALRRANAAWNRRLARTPQRPPVPEPSPEALSHVRESLACCPSRPRDLYNLHEPADCGKATRTAGVAE